MAKIAADITESYLAELGELLESARKDVLDVKASPGDAALLSRLLRTLHTIKGNSRMLGYQTIEKLAHSVEDLYKSIKDGRIKNSDRLVRVVFFVLDKIAVCSSDIRKKGFDTEEIDLYLQYCDKMAAGELVDVDAVVKHRGNVPGDPSEGILLDDGEDHAGGADVLLGATVDEIVFGHVHRTAHDVGAHVSDEGNGAVDVFLDLGSVDRVVGGDVEVVDVGRDLVVLGNIGIVLVGRAGESVSLSNTLGLLESLLRPDSCLKVSGLLLKIVHRHIEELQRGAATEEHDLMCLGDMKEFPPEGAALIHSLIPLLRAVGNAED